MSGQNIGVPGLLKGSGLEEEIAKWFGKVMAVTGREVLRTELGLLDEDGVEERDSCLEAGLVRAVEDVVAMVPLGPSQVVE
jgi:hypothetical protein